MTDKEIIKALECCVTKEDCDGCPYDEINDCIKGHEEDILDLITHQQAEIERLKECPKCVYEYDSEIMEYCVQGLCPNFKTVEQIKFEAYKEFAEKLKLFIIPQKADGYTREIILKRDIDNLLKELVGEDK